MSRDGTAAGRFRALTGFLIGLLPFLLLPSPAAAQSEGGGEFRLSAPSGLEIRFPQDSVMRMLRETRAYRDTLVQTPAILFYTGFGDPAPASSPAAAYPWNAVEVRSDSVARIATPGNLREGDRAYQNYAVARMKSVRAGEGGGVGPEPASCEARFQREARLLSAFADGWVVSRLLYGAPPFAPLDEVPFLRREGMLHVFLAAKAPPQLGRCPERWREENPERLRTYRQWHSLSFTGEGLDEAPADTAGG